MSLAQLTSEQYIKTVSNSSYIAKLIPEKGLHLWPRKRNIMDTISNMMDTISNRIDNHTPHTSPNYSVDSGFLGAQSNTIDVNKTEFKKNPFIWTYFLVRIDFGNRNDYCLVTGTIWGKSHSYKIYLQDRYYIDIICVQLQIMYFIYQVVCF